MLFNRHSCSSVGLICTSCARPQGGSQGGFAARRGHAALPRAALPRHVARRLCRDTRTRAALKPRHDAALPRTRKAAAPRQAGGSQGRGFAAWLRRWAWHVPTTINIEMVRRTITNIVSVVSVSVVACLQCSASCINTTL